MDNHKFANHETFKDLLRAYGTTVTARDIAEVTQVNYRFFVNLFYRLNIKPVDKGYQGGLLYDTELVIVILEVYYKYASDKPLGRLKREQRKENVEAAILAFYGNSTQVNTVDIAVLKIIDSLIIKANSLQQELAYLRSVLNNQAHLATQSL